MLEQFLLIALAHGVVNYLLLPTGPFLNPPGVEGASAIKLGAPNIDEAMPQLRTTPADMVPDAIVVAQLQW